MYILLKRTVYPQLKWLEVTKKKVNKFYCILYGENPRISLKKKILKRQHILSKLLLVAVIFMKNILGKQFEFFFFSLSLSFLFRDRFETVVCFSILKTKCFHVWGEKKTIRIRSVYTYTRRWKQSLPL